MVKLFGLIAPLKCLQQGGIRIVAANGGGRSGSIVTPHYNNQPPFIALSHGTQPAPTHQILFSSHCSLVHSLQCRSATVSLPIQGRQTHHGNHSGRGRYTTVTLKGVTSIGVPGSFLRGGQPFLSAKTQSCSAKKISSQGGPIFPILF